MKYRAKVLMKLGGEIAWRPDLPKGYKQQPLSNASVPQRYEISFKYDIDPSPPQDLDLKKTVDDMQLQLNEIMELIIRRQMPNPPVNLIDTEESDDDTERAVSLSTRFPTPSPSPSPSPPPSSNHDTIATRGQRLRLKHLNQLDVDGVS
ncbi:hypothetical protein Tco_0041000 [Tanacetum coccineum]